MRLVLVNRFFHPDLSPTGRLAARLAFAEAAAGREVLVLASRQRYEDASARLPIEETIRGVRVRRVWSTHFGRGGLAGRVLDYLSFHLSVLVSLLRELRSADAVVAMTDPPLLSVTVALAAAWRGAVLVNWLQDVFPETALRAGVRFANGPLGTCCRWMRDWTLRRAGANVVLGERMAQEVARSAPAARITVIPNWGDGQAIGPQAPRESPDFVVGYSGNLGRVHDVETILDAARRLAGEPALRFRFTGGGFHFERVRQSGLANVIVQDYVPEAELPASLAACDVHLVSLLPAFEGLVVPSKFYAIAAAARPVVFIGERQGELARLIDRHGLGIAVSTGDGDGLAAALRRLRDRPDERRAMGERARVAFEREWDEPAALARWRALLLSLDPAR